MINRIFAEFGYLFFLSTPTLFCCFRLMVDHIFCQLLQQQKLKVHRLVLEALLTKANSCCYRWKFSSLIGFKSCAHKIQSQNPLTFWQVEERIHQDIAYIPTTISTEWALGMYGNGSLFNPAFSDQLPLILPIVTHRSHKMHFIFTCFFKRSLRALSSECQRGMFAHRYWLLLPSFCQLVFLPPPPCTWELKNVQAHKLTCFAICYQMDSF